MKTSAKSVFGVFSIPLLLTLATCDSSHDRVLAPCSGVEECDHEGQILCMSDTRYRQCMTNGSGCLVWDCST